MLLISQIRLDSAVLGNGAK